MSDDLRLTALFRARYRSFDAISDPTVQRLAKSGTIDQDRESFGHQNPVHEFMKIERRPGAQPGIKS